MTTTGLTFLNILAVSSIWNQHIAEGRLGRNAAGLFIQGSVRRKASGQKISEEHEQLQREKLTHEVRRLKIQIERDEHKLGVEQGKYLPREDFEFDAGFRFFFNPWHRPATIIPPRAPLATDEQAKIHFTS